MINLYKPEQIAHLNQDIVNFDNIFPITSEMKQTFSGISRLIMLDRYTYKAPHHDNVHVGDLVVLTVKDDPKYPTRGIGTIVAKDEDKLTIEVEEEFSGALDSSELTPEGYIVRNFSQVEKPLELFFEQITKRVATGIAAVENSPEKREKSYQQFYQQLVSQNFIPAGRVLYGAGTPSEVTYFNCFVMPFIHDSRTGLAKHRQEVMEIMSRGGGVGTNGSTLRPKSSVVHGVNGKSSGAISWLNDLASLTNLVEQGGSRRGAQMIMMADWHPDIFEFILSKIQNPHILQHLVENSKSPIVRKIAKDNLNFVPLSTEERSLLEFVAKQAVTDEESRKNITTAKEKLAVGGSYQVKDPDFLTGANISVCLTKDFMTAVENNEMYSLRFPDIESYTPEEMADYDANWQEIGDVREWEKTGRRVRVYEEIPARDLWDLINFCATYSAEPGIFFIDNANEMTNAVAYGQKVVATNPCGEQPLTPYAVCNLSAINLANMVKKDQHVVDVEKLKEAVRVAVRFQDNVIDATPYFFDKNEQQAKGERRVGLGVMGLADLLIYCGKTYGSKEGNALVDKVFHTMAVTAYETSVELAVEKGSFPYLNGATLEETVRKRQLFINSGYMQKMPESLKEKILENGIRNSHLLTVAPTGSTGTMAGVSTGLEPYYSFSYFRSGRLGKFIEVKAAIVEEYLASHPEAVGQPLPEFFVSAMDLAPEDHVNVQCAIQRWVDSSISKTVNAPAGYSVSQVAKVYEALYRGGAKGGTVYVDGSRDSQVLTLTKDENSFEETSVEEVVTIDEAEMPEICPICHEGEIVEMGGCSTCTHCKVQLKCGL